MKKQIWIYGVILLFSGGLLLAFSPDGLSMLVVGIMCVLVGLGFFLGIMPTIMFGRGFKNGINNIEKLKSIQADDNYVALMSTSNLFMNNSLDSVFEDYKLKFGNLDKSEAVDISQVINEDLVEMKTWRYVTAQIPDTLTGLGILGTFIGLIIGISQVRFSSVDVAIGSLQTLLLGVSVAFYTSLAGVVLSIIFNMIYKFSWNIMLQNLQRFYRLYYMEINDNIYNSDNVQKFYREIIDRLDRIIDNKK